MRRAVEKLKRDNKKSTFVLQLTAMVDMFTIIIVFLLKSFSTSAVNIEPQKGLKLPVSTSSTNPIEGLKMVVSKEGVFVNSKQIVVFKDGKILDSDVEAEDPRFVVPLFNELDKYAKQSQEIAKINEEHKFEGVVVVQADSSLSYEVLRKIMYTSSMAGYAEMKMATISME